MEGLPHANGKYLRFKCCHCDSCYIVFYKDSNGIYSYSDKWSTLQHFQLKQQPGKRQIFVKGLLFHNNNTTTTTTSNNNKQEILAQLIQSNDSAFSYTKCNYFSCETNDIYERSDCYGIFNPPSTILAKIKVFSDLVHNKVNGHCVERRNVSTENIIQNLLTHGIQTTVNKVKKASVLVNKQQLEEHLESIQYIIPWLEVMKEKNPSFHFKVDRQLVGDCNMLQRINIVFPYTKELVESQYMIKLLGIDGAHMKDIVMQSCELLEEEHSKELKKYTFEGMRILLLTSKTCFNNMIILAMSLCFTENTDEFVSLIATCQEAGVNLDRPSLTFISDRSRSIVNAIQQSLPMVYHAFCPLHLERNLISKGFKSHLILYHIARKARSHHEYLQCMNRIKQVSLDMYTYLNNIERWQMYTLYERSLRFGNTLYEVGSDNLVESPFSWLLTARKLSPYYMIKNIITNILVHQQRCEEKVSKCNDIISPYAALTFSKRFNQSNNNFIIVWGKRSSNGSAVVKTISLTTTTNQFQVDLERRTCGCYVWQQTGIPCRHAIACVKDLQTMRKNNIRYVDYFDPICKVECAKNMYKYIPSLTKTILPNDVEVFSLYNLNVGEEHVLDLHNKYSLNIPIKNLKNGDELTRNRKLSRGEEGKRLSSYKKNGVKLPCPACGKRVVNLAKHSIGTSQSCFNFAVKNQDKVKISKSFWQLPENKILLQFNNWGVSEDNVIKLLSDEPFFDCKEALPLLILNSVFEEEEEEEQEVNDDSNSNSDLKRKAPSDTNIQEDVLHLSSDDDISDLNHTSTSSLTSLINPLDVLSSTLGNAKLMLSKLAGQTLSLVGLDDSDYED